MTLGSTEPWAQRPMAFLSALSSSGAWESPGDDSMAIDISDLISPQKNTPKLKEKASFPFFLFF